MARTDIDGIAHLVGHGSKGIPGHRECHDEKHVGIRGKTIG